ncbi:UbiA prenyltransferase family-domain-containing protein [Penicillium brevicompactum]|uniref:UbiA prenyltransferase family-domain-containing protein n=1 Tax=Penicillium brevicompactum TaxID=5074 RepID=A0A9W9UVV0_PENBR|nr:UbiA prenyltransferase family-domain-containing protein [Penicillium brevicompactum]
MAGSSDDLCSMCLSPAKKSSGICSRETCPSDFPRLQNPFSPSHLAKTLWLFTESDFATFVIPDTAFGIFGALSGPLLSENHHPNLFQVLGRLPAVILWNWSNLLIFDLANQQHPESVLEDKVNKPWRPLPSGRISMAQTQHMILIAIPVVLVLNYYLGAWEETALLFVLTWIYNDLGGGEDGFVIRNTVIATAFSQYNKGSLRVATQGGFTVKPDTWCWLVMTSAVIATTMHVQDMKDQKGDAIKGRRTVPLVLGDSKARWTIAVPTVVWSIACPAFWRLSPSLDLIIDF